MLDKDRFCLLGITESVNRIDQYVSSTGIEGLPQDSKTLDACLMHLINIGEMVSRLSEAFTVKHSEIDWYKSRGLRNIIAHDYFGIDNKEVVAIIRFHLPILKSFLEANL